VNSLNHFRIRLSQLPQERLNALGTLVVQGPNLQLAYFYTVVLRRMVSEEQVGRHIAEAA